MKSEEDFKVLKRKMERIRSELDTKKGERQAALKRIEKEFGVDESQDLYELLKDLSAQMEVKEEKRGILMEKVQGILGGYAE